MKKIFWAVTFCFMMIFNATVSAENIDAKQALRDALMANAGADDRIFHEDLVFYIPNLQSEIELFGKVEKNTFNSSGEFNVWATSENGDSTELSVPFYAVQNGKTMKVYFQMDKKWYQFQSPSVAASVTDMLASPTDSELEKMLDEVKTVTILRDTDTKRTFFVRLDSEKLADEMKKEFEKNPADNLTADDKELQGKFFKYLDKGIRNADIWYMWTIGKSDGKTQNVAIHFSSLLQEIARAALDDKDQVWSDSIRDILEEVAYYSETKSYTNFLNDNAKKRLEIPKNVLSAKPIENISDATSKKK